MTQPKRERPSVEPLISQEEFDLKLGNLKYLGQLSTDKQK